MVRQSGSVIRRDVETAAAVIAGGLVILGGLVALAARALVDVAHRRGQA